ncbi:glucose PTS transporter subunit IIA [Corynebacterium sp.]|uniref:PTS sugar transporter subunit IIA n=1 Tax=Corynebacterium sp. TaxID=1720 RepID=UPI0026DA9952|nr:glucose PTS transporter subunit IIA [Corynebacterium sp.]MDO5076089.1 glucose PTS transporter subunit IIA [Corynebacterium sp.]
MISLFGFGKRRRLAAGNRLGIQAPVRGELFPLEQVPDPVFSRRILGFGFAVHTADDVIVAPVTGQIFQMLPSCHAFSIRTPEGVEILVHIGVDTVNLKGNGFRALRIQGDYVDRGEGVVQLENAAAIRSAVDCLDTMVLVTNAAGMTHNEPRFDAAFGENVLELER